MSSETEEPRHAYEPRILDDLADVESMEALVGNTPLFRMGEDDSLDFVKLENRNPSGSMRDRYIAEIVERALHAGQIRIGDTVVLASMDDSAVAASFIASVLGLESVVFAPESSSRRLVPLVERYGARIEWIGEATLDETAQKAAKWARSSADRFYVDGYRRMAVQDAYKSIATEILAALDGVPLGGFVTSVTTGATFREVSRLLRAKQPDLEVRGARLVENEYATAEENPYITQVGLAEVWSVRDEVASQMGLMLGPKGAACVMLARKLRNEVQPGRAIVALNPDAGQRYLGWENKELFKV